MELDSAILFLISIVTIIFLVTVIQTKLCKLPPSPRALPIIGHMHHLSPSLCHSLHKLSTLHGPLVYFRIGSKSCILASTPELAQEILKTHEPIFLNRPNISNLHYLTYGGADFATIYYGPYWKFMKQMVMNQILGTRTLDRFLPVRVEELNRFLNRALEKSKSGELMDVGGELIRLTNNVISRMMLSTRCSEDEEEAEEVRELVKEMSVLGRQFNLSDTFWFVKMIGWDVQGFEKRLKDVRDRYDVMMERIIEEHQELRRKMKIEGNEDDDFEQSKDVLHMLLDIYEDENAEMKLTRENIKAFIVNIFGAGTDTSSTLIEWGISELIKHPSAMNKARQEIDSVVGKNRLVQESDIQNLPYLQAILKEILRLHPTGPLVVRESSKECSIAGYTIPARTTLFVNIWSLGRDQNHWNDPDKFEPERFMGERWNGKSNMLDVRGQYFQLLPFGSGRRSCPGASLALRFVPTTLAAMIQCFNWKFSGDGEIDMEEDGVGLTLGRASPLLSVPIVRLNLFSMV
ncbi:3,9-dihydroxypterocarpan 6A-monooxygenase [Linum perenne]